jgi:hypothetical protein
MKQFHPHQRDLPAEAALASYEQVPAFAWSCLAVGLGALIYLFGSLM